MKPTTPLLRPLYRGFFFFLKKFFEGKRCLPRKIKAIISFTTILLLMLLQQVSHAQLSFQSPVYYATGTDPLGAAVADFNKDGKADLATANGDANTVSVLLGKSDGTFNTAASYGVPDRPFAIITADFNADGKLDIATENLYGSVSVLLGKGDGTFNAAANFSGIRASSGIAAADFNKDGKPDIVVSDQLSNNVWVLRGNGDGTFGAPSSIGVGATTRDIAAADFNGDGKADIVTANPTPNNVSVLLGNGDGTFGNPTNYGTGAGPNDIELADVNSDGKTDIISANYSGGNVSVLLGNSNGTFQPAATFGVGIGYGTYGVAVADFDGDGKPDIASTNGNNNNISVLPGNGNGTFGSPVLFAAGQQPYAAPVSGDFNGDGKPDIANSNNGSNNVSVFLNSSVPCTAVSITTQPTNATVCSGNSATFSVAATGSNLAYKWKKGSTVLSTTTATLTINDVQPSDAGTYTVDVIGNCSTVTSNAATLTLKPATQINTQPPSTSVCLEGSATFTVSASGSNLIYKWFKDGQSLSNNSPTLTLNNVQASDAGKYTVQVIGDCGTATSDAATLTINTKPVVTVPANITASSGASNCEASVSFAATATGSPAPSIAYTIGETSITSPYTFPLGTTTVTAVATNDCGTDTKTLTVTVEDKTAPSFTAPADRNVSLGASCSIAIPNLISGLTGSDNCGAVSFSQNPVAGTAVASSHNQTHVVTITADDGHGNTTSHDVTLTAKDNTPPSITAPAGVLTATDNGACSTNASHIALGTPTYSDNCSGVTVSNDAPAIFPKGVTTITWTATDAAGNKAMAAQTVTVEDKEAPAAPDLPVVASECSATITAVNGTDNCDGAIVPTTEDPLAYTEQGTYTIHWTYTDEAGNSTVKEQTVVIKDVTRPVPNAASLPDLTGECSVTVANKPTATDNCAGEITATTTDDLSYTQQGTYTIHWVYSDGNGNYNGQEQTVIVKDATRPVPDAASLPDITGECAAAVSTKPTATDNCAGSITAKTDDPLSYTAQGTYTVHWTYDDGNGNLATQTQNVIVKDVTKPVPDVATLPVLTGECSVAIAGKPTATDNCAGKITATTNDAPSYTAQGTYTIHWTYSDGNGNTTTQEQTVMVKDITKPLITAPAAVSVSTDAGKCSAGAVMLGTPATSDNCTVASVSNNAPAVFPKGITTVTWTVTDAAGNQATATQMVTVTDNEKPVIACPVAPATVCYSSSGTYSIASLQASDNCGIASTAYSITGATTRSGSGSNASGTFNTGISAITWTVKDASGNTATCQTTVTINNLLTVSIPDAKVLSSGVDANTVYVGYTPAGTITLTAMASGGSGSYSYKWSTGATTQSIKVSPTSQANYTVTVTDAKGCTGTAGKQVSVTDAACGSKVNVCHGGKSLCVDKTSVPDHLGHGDYLGACHTAANVKTAITAQPSKEVEEAPEPLEVNASPNPSNSYFTLHIKKYGNEKAVLTITDMLGRKVESRTVVSGALQIGAAYRPGVYIATITQGDKRATVKLIKQG